MKLFTTSSRIVVSCSKRLAPYLQEEMIHLGFKNGSVFPTAIHLEGNLTDCIRLNMNLRCASQVFYSLKNFQANHPDHIYREVLKIPWEEIIPQNDAAYLSVTNRVDHPSVNNSLFMNVKVKDAIMDRLREKTGTRPDSGPALDRTVIHLFWQGENAEIFIDTSGETLSKHGYRKIPGKAPMMESLAAATLMATKWDQKSPFINPMCGSGTIAIEAALITTNRKPGLFRKNYGFMHLKGYNPEMYLREKKNLEAQIKTSSEIFISASDISEEAIKISKINAAAAGVENLIHFSVGDFEKTPVPETAGVVYFNPEYGERLGSLNELENTYSRMGDFLKKKCKGYWGYIFTGNLDLAKKIGLKPNRRLEFFSAKLDCRLLEYELYAGTRSLS